ncbi:transglycosylase SLT domain-containing protein [Marimonas arenosa]|uniref:Transglycosylase SLT domain-containing protein n=2 Tax=Marimonas arenosa TaxID=1795305 RepID=A0AAE3WD80_9RHOB|nr:transglycosylase SLT domain-containing protein [Marimonas arenosa]MDQ2090567.1 transglycosylase SLT domain-containing protein [Marimonas arenosa]
MAPEQVCDHVATLASQKSGVPLSVLQAITRTETGRKKNHHFTPWPWTVNMEGKGVWFDSLDEARAFVFRHFKRGARSFDVGCFQINYKWHHKAFDSIDEMFDPEANALYAAAFLKELYAEKGSWTDAAGAYHSRTPKYAKRYKAIFEKHRRNTPADPVAAGQKPVAASAPRPLAPRVNTFPLLRAGTEENSNARLGSLVPLGNRAAASGFLQINRRPSGLAGG